MRAHIVLFNNSFFNIGNTTREIELLNTVIETKELAKLNEDIIYSPGEWDYTFASVLEEGLSNHGSLNSKKKAHLFKLIFQGTVPLFIEVNSIEECNTYFPDRNNALLEPIKSRDDYQHIFDVKSWYYYHRTKIVLNPPGVESFCNTLAPYFNHLYFNQQSIARFLPSLHSGGPVLIIRTIMHHLAMLNDVFFYLYQTKRQLGLNRVCELFEQQMNNNPIPFGCSVDIDNIPSLEITFPSNNNETDVILYCDAHTKLWGYFENAALEDQGDRIYFHQPVADLHQERILIARIGRHREQ